MASAWADGTTVTFRVPDSGYRLAGVRLSQDVRIPGDQLDFRRVSEGAGAGEGEGAGGEGDAWKLAIGQPPVTRMEYLLEFRYPDGGARTVTDPGNPRQVDGAFGPKSVLEFAAYRPPGWLRAAGVAGRWLPRLRAALLGPGSRDDWYSANPAYARALTTEVIPALDARLATSVRIGMGTSLGGLAMLHAHCHDPAAFAGLFLQSGSFFWPRFDGHESWFGYYPRITAFAGGFHRAGQHGDDLPDRPVPTVLTCGAIEENLPNNRLMADALRSRGYPAELHELHELPDMHNYTAWRDAFDPHLTRLLRQVCG